MNRGGSASAGDRNKAPMVFAHGDVAMAVHRMGDGPLPMLAFHGFGRGGTDFQPLVAALNGRCAVHAFDLPFHGNSPSPTGRMDHPYMPGELAAFITAYLRHIGAERALLLGHSLGGRFVLSLLEQLPERIAAAFLAAPDGLQRRPWYRALAGFGLGRRAYAGFVRHPGPVHGGLRLLRRTGLLDGNLFRFLMGQTDTMEKRELVRRTWLAFRLLEPDLRQVAANLRARQLPVHLFFGTHDRVIRPKTARRLQPLAPGLVHLHLLDGGHGLLTPELGTLLAALLPQASGRTA